MTVEQLAREHAITVMMSTPGTMMMSTPTRQFVYDGRPLSCRYRGRDWGGHVSDQWAWCALADWIDDVDRRLG